MQEKMKKKSLFLSLILAGVCHYPFSTAYAAKLIHLHGQASSVLSSFISSPKMQSNQLQLKEVQRTTDFKKTLHIRLQETFSGYPIWGADAIMHIPNGAKQNQVFARLIGSNQSNTVNGQLYQDIAADLAHTPAAIYNEQQTQKALQHQINLYEQMHGQQAEIKEQTSKLIVFVDHEHKAHWAYQVSFYAVSKNPEQLPEKPVFIIDAVSFYLYQTWNDIKTLEEEPTMGGGFGGNEKIGELVYDGLEKDLPQLNILRDEATQICYLKNADVTVKSYRTRSVVQFPCLDPDGTHNNIFWDGELEAVNGGYSPDNDALFGGAVIKDLYQSWYGIPVLTQNDKPMMLNMVVHAPIDNAYWDGHQMTFGDGVHIFYPLTSLGVAAHEISHGFTEQHSNLAYYGQSGGMNESYSDMAAQAAELFAYGKNSWQIGPEIFKGDKALRYMEHPSQDCGSKKPGDRCSIDEVSQYYSGLDVHYSSGIFNRAFYLIATSEGWDVKKAFDVMVQANRSYWTSKTDFIQGACGVMDATRDYGYDVTAVTNAFAIVGIDMEECKAKE